MQIFYFAQERFLCTDVFDGADSIYNWVCVLVNHAERREDDIQPFQEIEVVKEFYFAELENVQIVLFVFLLCLRLEEFGYIICVGVQYYTLGFAIYYDVLHLYFGYYIITHIVIILGGYIYDRYNTSAQPNK